MNPSIGLRWCAVVVAIALAFVVVPSAHAAGILVDTQSGRATGMASAVTADSPDASAVLFNPAEIVRDTEKPKLSLLGGVALIIPSVAFKPEGGGAPTDATTPLVPPVHAYGTYGIMKDLAVGIGIVNLWGLKVSWPDDWAGAQLIQKATLTTYVINPEVAYRFGPVKVGAGFQLVRATVDLQRAVNYVDSVGQIRLADGTWGVGGNAGVSVAVIPDRVTFGATYRSRVKLNFNNGRAHFSDVPPEFAGSGPGQIHDQNVKTTLWLPDWVTLGVSVRPIPKLKVNFDAEYFSWQVVHELKIDFDDPALNQLEPKNWNHTWNFHLGAEYALSDLLAVRVGGMWDPSPSPDDTLAPDIPDTDRINLACGLGLHYAGFNADAGYQYIFFLDHTSTLPALPGTYGGHVHLFGISLGYSM